MKTDSITVKLFTPDKVNVNHIDKMIDAQEQFEKAHPNQLKGFTHGVGDDGTVGGITESKNKADFKALAYCSKPDGTLITTYYFPKRKFYICGDAGQKTIHKYIAHPSGKQSTVEIKEEFWGDDYRKNIPTYIKKIFHRHDGKEAYILKENKPNGDHIRTVKYPSGNIYTKHTNAHGDIIEYKKTQG